MASENGNPHARDNKCVSIHVHIQRERWEREREGEREREKKKTEKERGRDRKRYLGRENIRIKLNYVFWNLIFSSF